MHDRDATRTATLVIVLLAWLGVLTVLSFGVLDAWRSGDDMTVAGWRGGTARRPPLVDALVVIGSIAAGGVSLVGGTALWLLTWAAVPPGTRGGLPWVTGLWAVVTFAALCGALQPGRLHPYAALAMAVGAWLAAFEVVRVIVTALVARWSETVDEPGVHA